MTVTLSTTPRDEAKLLRLADYKGLITWRLEVRRGLVEVRGRLVSATAVVGVQFDTGVVLRDQRDFAVPAGRITHRRNRQEENAELAIPQGLL